MCQTKLNVVGLGLRRIRRREVDFHYTLTLCSAVSPCAFVQHLFLSGNQATFLAPAIAPIDTPRSQLSLTLDPTRLPILHDFDSRLQAPDLRCEYNARRPYRPPLTDSSLVISTRTTAQRQLVNNHTITRRQPSPTPDGQSRQLYLIVCGAWHSTTRLITGSYNYIRPPHRNHERQRRCHDQRSSSQD